jgi:3-dehydroquinate dehydratase-2
MDKKKIAIINGPNINILGKRERSVYGIEDWGSIEDKIKVLGQQIDAELLFYQSNYEGDIVNFIQQNMDELSGVVINPAALSKTGYSILDALNALPLPYVEVHLSNIVSRGGWHAESIFTDTAVGFLMGLKGYVYELGLQAINHYLEEKQNEKVSD